MGCPLILPVELVLLVPDVDVVLGDFDRIQIHRSTSGEYGSYQEITDQYSRIVLQPGVTRYQYVDPEGSDQFWYRFRYYNSATQAVDTFSSPQPGALDSSLDLLSVEELKQNYLFGIDLTDDAGTPYPDGLFAHYIINAVSWFEHKLDIPIRPVDFEEECQDFYRDDYTKYLWIELNHFPVVHVRSVKMVLPGEQTVQEFRPEWIRVQRESGQVQIVPGAGAANTLLLGAAGAWMPFIVGANKFVPDLWRINYRAGFGRPAPGTAGKPDPMLDQIPYLLRDMIGKYASCGPLNIAGDLLVGAGVASQSLGIDGLSQSISTTSSATNAGYGARIIQYTKDLKDQIPSLIRYYKGLRMRVA